MRKKKKRTRINKQIVVLSVIIGAFMVAAVASYLTQSPGVEKEPGVDKKPAKEYFKVLNATIDYAEPRYNDTAIIAWEIFDISFTLQAVGGDANNVIVQSWANAEPVELGDIQKDHSKYVTQSSPPPFGYLSEINENEKFPMTIRITSEEAEGKITIYF